MKDRYKDFSEESFEYKYPFSWKKRNKYYLKLRENRELIEKKDKEDIVFLSKTRSVKWE